MISIRNSVFETNSSSCHSITVMKKSDWEDFKARKVYINRNLYDMEEHYDRFNIIKDDERDSYFKPIDKLYTAIKDIIDSNKECPMSRSYYTFDERDFEIWQYLKNNFSFEVLMKLFEEKNDVELCKLEKPIVITYHYGNGDRTVTYDSLTVGDVYGFIFSYGYLGDIGETIPNAYIYGCNGQWAEAKVEEYIKVGEEDKGSIVVVTRDEEC